MQSAVGGSPDGLPTPPWGADTRAEPSRTGSEQERSLHPVIPASCAYSLRRGHNWITAAHRWSRLPAAPAVNARLLTPPPPRNSTSPSRLPPRPPPPPPTTTDSATPLPPSLPLSLPLSPPPPPPLGGESAPEEIHRPTDRPRSNRCSSSSSPLADCELFGGGETHIQPPSFFSLSLLFSRLD